MSRLSALLKKEWRDARTQTLAAVVLAPALSVALQLLFLHFQEPHFSAMFVVPGLVALFAGAIASELVAGEVATRRVETLAALPASPLFVWGAKCLFLLAVAVPFLFWAFACELVIFAVARGSAGAGALFGAAPTALPMLLLVVPLASCVLFFSTIFDRGLSAFLAGVAVVVGVHYGLVQIARDNDLARRLTIRHIAALEAALTLACLAGSAAAFRMGEVHLPSKTRRVVVGLGLAVALLAVPATAGAMALRRWSSFGPDNPDVRIVQAQLSPDEGRLAIGVNTDERRDAGGVWLLDLNAQRLAVIDNGHACLAPDAWTADGRLRIARWTASSYLTHGGTSYVEVDPATRAESAPQSSESFHAKQLGFGWARVEPAAGGPSVHAITWHERGLRRELERPQGSARDQGTRNFAAPLPTPGLFLWCSDGKLVREDLVSGKSTAVVPEGVENFELSPDGTRAIVHANGASRPRIIDVDDGHIVLDLGGDAPRWATWARGHHANRMVVQETGDPCAPVLIDLHDGSRIPMPRLSPNTTVEIARDGRIFVVRFDGALEMLDTAGRRLRRLWEPPK